MRVWSRREDRADFRVARMEALTAEIHRNREKRPEPFGPRDFFKPRVNTDALRPKPAEGAELKAQMASFELFNSALGGRDLRAERRAGLVDAQGNPIYSEERA